MRLALLILLLLWLPVRAQEPHCPKLTYHDLTDHSEIWVENPYDIQSALSFQFTELTNVKPDKPGPLLLQVAPHQKFQLIRLVAIDPAQRLSGNTGYTAGPHLHFMVFRARDGYSRESFPMKFKVAESAQPVAPVEGESYTHLKTRARIW